MYSDFIFEPFFSEIYQDKIADLTQRLWSRPHGYDTAHPLIPFIVFTAICSVYRPSVLPIGPIYQSLLIGMLVKMHRIIQLLQEVRPS